MRTTLKATLMVLALAGSAHAQAQMWTTYDSQGNSTRTYVQPGGNWTTYDSRGNSERGYVQPGGGFTTYGSDGTSTRGYVSPPVQQYQPYRPYGTR